MNIIDTSNGIDPASFLTIEEKKYRSSTGLSQSSLKEFLRSPAHYLASTEAIQEPTPAMKMGTAFHAKVLLPDSWQDHYMVMPKVDGRTKEGKEMKAKFELMSEGRVVIDEDTEFKILKMREAIFNHSMANSYLQFAEARESALYGTYVAKNGVHVRLKGLVDAMNFLRGAIVDLKSAEDASPDGFRKAIWNRRYDIQVVHYLWLAKLNGFDISEFVFIASEKDAPYAVGCYTIKEESLVRSYEVWKNAIERFAECQQSGKYPAYSDDVIELAI